MLAPIALLLLDVLADREAFYDIPGEAGGSSVLAGGDLGMAPGDLFLGPHHAIRDVMQGADDANGARLGYIVNAGEVLGAEPTPGLSQLEAP